MAEAIERVHTGIPGLDHVLEGGFPKGARVLLAGGAGCGKTICCGQYLYKGATRYGEPGVYVSTEEPPSEFRANLYVPRMSVMTLGVLKVGASMVCQSGFALP